MKRGKKKQYASGQTQNKIQKIKITKKVLAPQANFQQYCGF